ncbi:MAG: hypothetical protein HQK69_05395 [Desulfamplus sp.]|nr:hypothetical protein [Desulfamplus sp.]
MRAIFILFILLYLTTGCTSRGVYDGMQQAASKDCEKYPYQSLEYEKCIDNANISYEQYKQDILVKKK